VHRHKHADCPKQLAVKFSLEAVELAGRRGILSPLGLEQIGSPIDDERAVYLFAFGTEVHPRRERFLVENVPQNRLQQTSARLEPSGRRCLRRLYQMAKARPRPFRDIGQCGPSIAFFWAQVSDFPQLSQRLLPVTSRTCAAAEALVLRRR